MKTVKNWPKCTVQADQSILTQRPRWASTRASSYIRALAIAGAFLFALKRSFQFQKLQKT